MKLQDLEKANTLGRNIRSYEEAIEFIKINGPARAFTHGQNMPQAALTADDNKKITAIITARYKDLLKIYNDDLAKL